MGAFLKHIIFAYMDFMFCPFWQRPAPKHDEDPFHKISNNHGYGTNIYQQTWMVVCESVGSKIAYHKVFITNEFKIVDYWKFWKSENWRICFEKSEVWKHTQILFKQKHAWKHMDFLMNHFEMLVSPIRSASPALFGKKEF